MSSHRQTTSEQANGARRSGVDGALPGLEERKYTWLTFSIPALLAVPLSLVGRFWVGEILAFFVLPVAYRHRVWLFSNKWMRWLLVGGAIWLVSAIISDIWRATSSRNMFRGWGEIVITLVMLVVLRVLIGSSWMRLRVALVGASLGTAGRLILFPMENERAVPWRLGGVWVVAVLVLLLVDRLPRPFNRTSPELVMGGLAASSLILGSRNMAGVAMLSALYLLGSRSIKGSSRSGLSRRQVVMGALLALAVSAAIVGVYSTLASSGRLGEAAQVKYELQSGGAFGIVIGGRQGLVSGLVAVWKSPVVGYGSRAEGPIAREIQLEAAALLSELGYTSYSRDTPYIPSHSFVVGSWVAAGVGALPFWLAVLVVALTALTVAYRLPSPWNALVAFLGIGLLWDWLFSPFGGPNRTLVSLSLVALVMTIESVASSDDTTYRPG